MKIKLRKQLLILVTLAGTCFGWTCGPTNPPENPICAAISTLCIEDLDETPIGELP